MVAVAPVKLTLHLGFACLFLAGLVYAAARIAGSSPDEPIRGLGTPFLLFSLVFLQIILGGLVAGSRAGFTLNEWPLLDGAFLPPIAKLFVATPWFENFVDNPTLVQFNHRMMAYLLGILALWHAIAARRAAASPRARRAAGLCGLVLAQIALGIATVLLVVPLWAGLAHQALAMLVLAKAARHLALSRS